MKLQRILTFLVVLLGGSSTLYAESEHTSGVPLTTDLQADIRQAQARGVPLLLMFSMDDCHYCMVVHDEFLDPMQRNRDYDDKVLMRIVKMDEGYISDIDGQRVPVDDLAVRYGASVAPTVVLLDHQGQLLVKRLLGINTPGYYGLYLDRAIEKSNQRLREQRAKLDLVQN